MRNWLRSLPRKPRILVEPFAGGGIIGLTAAFERLAGRVVLVEIDDDVAAVWKTILSDDADELCRRILAFEISRAACIAALESEPRDEVDHAFQTILRNRVQRGGILAPGASLVRHGENGKGVASRWYPQTLASRIAAIRVIRDRIEFRHCDAFQVIHDFKAQRSAAFFVDPPYTAGGKKAGSRLYLHNTIDHELLFSLMARVRGPFALTYDDADEVRSLATRNEFQLTSIRMKNTHHSLATELVVTGNIRRLAGVSEAVEDLKTSLVRARDASRVNATLFDIDGGAPKTRRRQRAVG